VSEDEVECHCGQAYGRKDPTARLCEPCKRRQVLARLAELERAGHTAPVRRYPIGPALARVIESLREEGVLVEVRRSV